MNRNNNQSGHFSKVGLNLSSLTFNHKSEPVTVGHYFFWVLRNYASAFFRSRRSKSLGWWCKPPILLLSCTRDVLKYAVPVQVLQCSDASFLFIDPEHVPDIQSDNLPAQKCVTVVVLINPQSSPSVWPLAIQVRMSWIWSVVKVDKFWSCIYWYCGPEWSQKSRLKSGPVTTNRQATQTHSSSGPLLALLHFMFLNVFCWNACFWMYLVQIKKFANFRVCWLRKNWTGTAYLRTSLVRACGSPPEVRSAGSVQ